MQQRLRILPYKKGSKSAKALAERLGGKVLRLEGSKFKPRPGDFIINWGNSQANNGVVEPVLNVDTTEMKAATNKLWFFQRLNNMDLTPKWWDDASKIPDNEFPIVCRTVLNGHSGVGIVIANTRNELVPAPLYTKYVKKKEEYRIHCGRTEGDEPIAISVQRKVRKNGVEPKDWRVRNLDNGFVYQRNNINPPECVINIAMAAMKEFNKLDFCAIDVIYNDKEGRAYVLEINTAPGLEGTTLEDYASYFQMLMKMAKGD